MGVASVKFALRNNAGNLLLTRVVCESRTQPFVTDSNGNTWTTYYSRLFFKKYWVVKAYVRDCASGDNAVTATYDGQRGLLRVAECE